MPVLVFVSPAVAETIAPAAVDLGLTHAGTLPLMLHDGRGLADVASTVTVTRVERGEDLLVTSSIIARQSHTRGCAAALGAVMTIRHGEVVSIWCVATLLEQQRSGIGRALLRQVMARYRRSGARCFFLLATEAAYPLYERLGFHTMQTPSVWLAGHSTQVHTA